MQVGVKEEIVNFPIFLILDKVAQEMTAASKVWPYYTPWTLSDVKTAAWLVEKGHLTQLETVMISSDLDTSSVWGELVNIRRVASNTLSKPDQEILIKPKGLDIFKIFYISFLPSPQYILCSVNISINSLTKYVLSF